MAIFTVTQENTLAVSNSIDSFTIKILFFIFFFSGFAIASPHNFKTVEGGALYLERNGFETHRAEFVHAKDCTYIANIMSKVEPNVRWYCSTSTSPINYKCSFYDIKIINTDTNKTQLLDFKDIKYTLNRGFARTTSSANAISAINSFTYKSFSDYIELTNDYPYANGNYLSRAIYKVKLFINKNSKVFDINMNENGRVECSKL